MSNLGVSFLLVNTLNLRGSLRQCLLNLPRYGLIWANSTSTGGFVQRVEVIQEALGDSVFVCSNCLKMCITACNACMAYCPSQLHGGECCQRACTPWQCTQQQLFRKAINISCAGRAKKWNLLPALGLSVWSMGVLSSPASSSSCATSDVTLMMAPSKVPPFSCIFKLSWNT